MPKRQTQRIIDNRSANRAATTISGVTLTTPNVTVTAGDGLTLSGNVLDVIAGDGVSVTADSVAVDSTVVRTTRTVTAGSGLTGGGALSGDITLNVGAGTLITVGADSVGITAGANYQYIGTGSGTAAAWQNLSTLAGSGLTHSAGVLAVGAGSGITVNADDVALTTPGTLTAATSNSATGNHTHAITTGAASTLTVATSNATGSSASLARADHLHTITTSSNPGAAASILASSAAGLVQLVQVASNATFASGFAGSGYRVDYGVTEASKASAEFDNLTVRGRMRVYELLIQQIRATNGSVFVTSTGKAKAVTASTDPTWTVNGSQLTFNGSNATLATALYTITTSDSTEDASDKSLYHGFLTGDLIRAQQTEWNGSTFAGVYQSDLEVTSVASLYAFTGARVSSGTSAAAVGYDYARLGSATDTTRQGTIYLTSDDSNAPFIDILDGVQAHSGWNASGNVKVRLGKLSGISDAYFGTLSGYGLYSDNVYLRGSIYATDGVFSGTVYASAGTFTGAITAASGSITGFLTLGTSGGIYQGTGTAETPTTGLKIWNDSGTGRIGGYSSGVLQWYAGTDGVLYAGAGRVILDGTGIAVQASSGTSATAQYAYRILESGANDGFEGGLYAYEGPSNVGQYVQLRAYNPDNPAYISLLAESGTSSISSIELIAKYSTTQARIYLGQGTVEIDGMTYFDSPLTLDEVASTPSNPSSGNRGRIYIRNDNLIIQFNDGGTVRYKYLALSGTGTTWTHSTTAP